MRFSLLLAILTSLGVIVGVMALAQESRESGVVADANSTPFGQTDAGSRATLEYNGVEFAFRYCPAGSFTMGSPEDEEGRYNEDQRDITIEKGFWIAETETTQAQWDAAGVKKVFESGGESREKFPVEIVSWHKSVEFVERLNESGVAPDSWRFDLPTEEQWEYSCRAGTIGSTYGVSLDECAWYDANCEDQDHEVGLKAPNKWGIYDMLGNVWEWTKSRYESDGERIVYRGGSWCDGKEYNRPAVRLGDDPEMSDDIVGFRIVLVPDLTK